MVKDSQSWGEVKEKFAAQHGANGLSASNFLSQWQ